MKDLLLGIDLGTSSCKIVAFTRTGEIVKMARKSYPVFRPRPGFVEQRAEDYWEAVCAILTEWNLESGSILADICSIGVTGQTSTEIFLDQEGKVLYPAITWQDIRAAEEAEIIRSEFSEFDLLGILGSNVPVSASWSASRMLWLSRHEPEIAKRVAKLLQPKDYVNFRLTGSYFADPWISKSLAHLRTGEVNPNYLRFLGFSTEVVAARHLPFEKCGVVSPEAASSTGLKAGTSVVCGCSDAPATMMGSGAFERPGIAFNCTGTSEIVGLSCGKMCTAEGLMTIPDHLTGSVTIVYGPTQSGSSSLLWLNEKITGQSYQEAVKGAESSPPGANGLLFLPYLNGERAPIWDPAAKGAFLGLTAEHDRDDLSRSVMEGVGFSLRHILSNACSVSDNHPDVLRISGGGVRDRIWCQIRADITQIPVELLACNEASALGAAMMAGIGAGYWSDTYEASRSLVSVTERLEPDREYKSLYDVMFTQYLKAYEYQRLMRKTAI